jgi:uncharacterized protein YqjF (DUF2071 family)
MWHQASQAWLNVTFNTLRRAACRISRERGRGQRRCHDGSVDAEAAEAAAAGGRVSVVPGTCPFTVDRPVMRQRWERLTFLHWPFDPAQVQRLLPAGLRAETFGGAAWVGLVPFFMRVATAGGGRVPWVSNFCETNVRTYVQDAEGRSGIWFFSLDAARLGAVAVARTTYRLPYFWSSMRLSGRGPEISYTCLRRWPGPRDATSQVRIGIGDPFGPGELTERDHFLTARWILFSVAGARYRFARAWHQPWPLHRAEARFVDDRLIAAAGLPQPQGPPLVHYSPGVDVRIGRPERPAGPGR